MWGGQGRAGRLEWWECGEETENVGNDVVKGQASGFAGVGCCSMESGEPSEFLTRTVSGSI